MIQPTRKVGIKLNTLEVATRFIQERMTGREVLSAQVKMSNSGSCSSTPWSQLDLLHQQTIRSPDHYFSSLLSKSSNYQAAICASNQGHWQQHLEWHPGQFFDSAGAQDGLLNLGCCFRDLLKNRVKFSECPDSKSRN